jgi:hypothetical protein
MNTAPPLNMTLEFSSAAVISTAPAAIVAA